MDRLQALEKSLNMMKESPMEYELTLSEIGRRQVILDNMKRTVVSSVHSCIFNLILSLSPL